MAAQKIAVCQVNDLQEGQLKSHKAADKDILLVRRGGNFYAIAAHCSHFGAPLEKGALSQGRIVCPWHNACFNLDSGVMLEPPGRDNLATYPVHVEAGRVYVEVSEDSPEQVIPAMATYDPQQDSRTFAIAGGGAAGHAAAETLRKAGFQGQIVILSADDEPPYDRTALSKAYLQSDSVDDLNQLRSEDFYRQHGIDLKLNAPVKDLDADAQQLTYGDGETLRYDALLLATGGEVRQLPIPGADLANVFTLRRAEDAKHILEAVQGAQQVVVIGAGFIGMEVAASLKQQGLDVTVVASSAVPFENVLGKAVGQLFQQVHEAQGIQFKLGTKAKAFQGSEKVASVQLETGETLPADLVVVGIGVKPATAFLEDQLLDQKDGSIRVDQYLQAAPNIYAAGDIAQFPYFLTGENVRIEHWRLALQQGRIAARNMMGEAVPFQSVPFFWTGQFNLKLRYVGHAETWDEVIIQGSLEDKSFLAFYVQADRVLAVAGIGRDRDIAAISELMRLQQMPSPAELRGTDLNWVERLQP